MSGKKVKPKENKIMDSSEDLHETVEMPAREVKKALAQLQAVAASDREEREHGEGENFESKIERAMQKIVSDTVGDEPVNHISPASKAPKAKTAGTIKVARAKGIRLDESRVQDEQEPSKKEEPVKPQVSAQDKKNQENEKKNAVSAKGKATKGDFGQKPQDRPPVPDQVKDPTEKRGRRGLVVAAVIIGVLLLGSCGVYAGVGNYYHDKFLPGTTINHIDCSGLSVEQAEQLIRKNVEDYSLTIYARNVEPQVLTAESIDYKYQPQNGVEKVMEEQQPMRWINSFFTTRSYTVGESISYDKEKVRAQMGQLDCMQPDRQVPPTDAHLEYQEGQFVVVPETQGTALDAEKVIEAVCRCVEESQESLDLETEDVYYSASITKDNQELVQEMEHLNSYAKASITYTFGDETEVLNGETIRNWIKTSEDGSVDINDEALESNVYAYVAELASRRDTLGASRTFTTSTGRVINVAGGNYGWQIDQYAEAIQLLEEIRSGQVVTREPNYASTALCAGASDIGNTYIEVDLGTQHMYYYREGSLIYESDFVSGKPIPERETPTGVCHMYYKKMNEVLRGEKKENGEYEYETPVQYWMPFNGGVGFHDASWQASFGGDVYTYNGSHGCINLPPDKAAELYEIIDTETPIVVFN
ncbi:MAG: L,D-transpeptidase family protein [Lachnospiraceae bacterium]|nr:L,D-transpeptidase family protein [Lachnospiraceae bacterium]MCI9545677.1 L,D-transpeptidase family protein [Lachnospiraceae bacterium]